MIERTTETAKTDFAGRAGEIFTSGFARESMKNRAAVIRPLAVI
jgi:hypothetical protein